MPLFNFKIEILPFAGYRCAYLKKRMFGCIWVTMDEQLQLNESDFMVVEKWMDRHGITAEHFKDLTKSNPLHA
jgi:hypothetical protein